jgi:dTDP-4-dehydrorhamnose reductase
MRVLVTGAGGQVGSRLAAHLLQTGVGVEVVACTHAELDLADPGAPGRAVAETRPDVIVNCAAITDVDRCEREPDLARAVNAEGPRRLAEAARSVGAHLVQVSTDYVFSGEQRRPYREDDPTGPLSVYGATKLEGERAAARAGSWAVGRTSWVFGRPGHDFVAWVLGLPTDRVTGVVDDQTSAPTFAGDLARALAALGLGRHHGVFHLAGAGACTRYGFARDILAAVGRDASHLRPITTDELPRPARRPVYSVLGDHRLATVGIAPLRHYREALDEYLAEGGAADG